MSLFRRGQAAVHNLWEKVTGSEPGLPRYFAYRWGDASQARRRCLLPDSELVLRGLRRMRGSCSYICGKRNTMSSKRQLGRSDLEKAEHLLLCLSYWTKERNLGEMWGNRIA